MTFGEKLKSIRKERGMNQTDFASFLGTSKQNLSRYENSSRVPSLKIATDFAQRLNVSVEYLTGTDPLRDIASRYDSSAPLTEKEISQAKRELIAAVDGLTDEQCEHLKALIDMVKR